MDVLQSGAEVGAGLRPGAHGTGTGDCSRPGGGRVEGCKVWGFRVSGIIRFIRFRVYLRLRVVRLIRFRVNAFKVYKVQL